MKEIKFISFLYTAVAGVLLGFVGSLFTFLSWIVLPFLGFGIHRAWLYHPGPELPSKSRSFLIPFIAGMMIGGIPIWVLLPFHQSDPLSQRIIMLSIAPGILLIGVGISMIAIKLRGVFKRKGAPPNKPVAMRDEGIETKERKSEPSGLMCASV